MATFSERLQWIFRLALMLFILASVGFLSALTAMRFAIQGREVAMPDVVGKMAAEAQQLLQGRGVGIEVEDRIYSSLPSGEIVRQSPAAGMRVKIGQFAHVIVSLGPQKVTIPALSGKSIRAARIELLSSGMQAGEISSAFLPGLPQETVLEQSPAPGTSNVSSPHVDLLVSLGARPPAYVMPAFEGFTLGEAETRANTAGLKVVKVTPRPGASAAPGTVVGQTPIPGARIEAGGEIELQVAE